MLGELTNGLMTAGGRLFVVFRQRVDRKVSYDVLTAFDIDDLSVLWDYQDGGNFLAEPSTNGTRVFLLDSAGKVVMFR